MELDALHSTECRKRKRESESQEWPCTQYRYGIRSPNPHFVDNKCKPLHFLRMNNGRWKAYTKEVNATICRSFAADKKSSTVYMSKQLHAVHFFHMQELHLQTGYVRSVAWIDNSGNFVTPARFLEGHSRLWHSLLMKKSQRLSPNSIEIDSLAS
ncbi:hypothetical protein KP509_04G030400 [Ceratopteris richardii]|uniref:RCD1 WWE domain-containing protein n=1 Tax=Ceratopteris richardii TaxID=49495 RepID=A0A8T2UVP1_CERRI|nr:hypothetical protein KP509_04G030400 [Ceratopteris richardii]